MGNLALHSAEEPDNLRATTGTVEVPTERDNDAALMLGARPIIQHQPAARHNYVQLLTDTSSTCYSGPDTKVVEMKSWGRLKVPSLAPMKLLEFIEQCVQNHAAQPCVDIYTDILNEAFASEQLAVSMIGSSVHASTLTGKCVYFCIVVGSRECTNII